MLRRVAMVEAVLKVMGQCPTTYLLRLLPLQLAKMLHHNISQLIKVE